MRHSRRTTAIAIAGAATFALVATGCSAGAPAASDEPITLTLATFNNFGYDDALLAEYDELHPNITIEHTIAATSNDARANYFTKLGAGSGLADVEAVEIDWFADCCSTRTSCTTCPRTASTAAGSTGRPRPRLTRTAV